MVQIAVVVAVLHLAALDESLLELGGGVERSLGHAAGDDVSHLGADESGTLAGLNVLELNDLHNLAFHLEGHAVTEIAGGNHCHRNHPPYNLYS